MSDPLIMYFHQGYYEKQLDSPIEPDVERKAAGEECSMQEKVRVGQRLNIDI